MFWDGGEIFKGLSIRGGKPLGKTLNPKEKPNGKTLNLKEKQ